MRMRSATPPAPANSMINFANLCRQARSALPGRDRAWRRIRRLGARCRPGTNPEQLFAAAWSACFEGAIAGVARAKKIPVPDMTIDAEVDLHLADSEYFLSARLNVDLSGIDRDLAEELVTEAHKHCPYSKATRGNIDVVINLV
jgi:Ohr subfamily peroxiredoxin